MKIEKFHMQSHVGFFSATEWSHTQCIHFGKLQKTIFFQGISCVIAFEIFQQKLSYTACSKKCCWRIKKIGGVMDDDEHARKIKKKNFAAYDKC